MKKPIVLIGSLIVVCILGWYAVKLISNRGKSDPDSTRLIEFAVSDIESVDKVIITDPYGNVFEIRKDGDIWTDKDGGCITQENAGFVIDAIKNIEFKGYLPDNSNEKITTLMSALHTKVEIFQNGEWSKTWYIGPPAQDHLGQIMLLDSEEFGKSELPVLMKIKGVHGIIEPRFYADPRKWMCTNIFSVPISDISSVDVKFNDEPERSFKVTKKGTDFDVYQQGKKLQNVDTAMIFRYLHNYKKIHFDIPNYELSEKQVDSVKNTIPFCVLTVRETNNKKTSLRLFRIKTKEAVDVGMASVEDVDRNKFWCQLPNGALVKCQYFVFNPLLLGHIYFPLDLSSVETHDGILPK